VAAILIVEDRPVDRQFLSMLLKSAGHTITEASDGVEGLLMARRAPPDLVISDILMPTVDGYEFVRRMRDVPALARTPVIFYTAAYHERDARALARQCGVAEILTKPSEPQIILAKIDAVLASGEHAPMPLPAPSEFSRDHLRATSAALQSKLDDFETSEHRMAAMVGLAHEIAAERDARVLLNKACAAAREATLAQHAIIMMLTDRGSAFRRVAASGVDDDVLARMEVAAVDGPAFARAIAERLPVRLRNPAGRPEAIGLPASDPLTYSSLVVPIASPSLVYGCLALRNKLGADGFSDRDEEVALALATHAGIAYENAQLYKDLGERSAALEQEVAERRRVEARTQLALAVARIGVWELDVAADRLDWSDGMAAIFGLLMTQVPRTIDEFSALIHAGDRAAFREALERAVAERTGLVTTFRTIWPDGTVHWIGGRARVLDDERSTRIVGVGIDVTERKSLEEQLRQTEKMEALGRLAGGLAHDFNNLLTVIHGYAELLLPTLIADDRRRGDVGEIVSAAERAAALTRQLLAFSRKQVLQPTLLDVNSLVIDLGALVRRVIGEHIELATKLAPVPANVFADAGQVEQILMNLAVNARDAMPQGGRLSIETATVVLDDSNASQRGAVRPGPYVMLAVTDTGIGMDEQTTQRLFEPFFTTKERGRGTGLGLATAYGIVRQSGGHIWVNSEPGRGSTFKVYLPRAGDAATVGRPPDERTAATAGSETVLVVEDEPAVRALARVLLERAGYRVLEARDLRQAEDVLRQPAQRIDLLVTDVIVRGSSGPSLVGRLSADHPHLRVLYMSGYTDDALVQQAALSPRIVFLQKPFTADGLLCKVREALDR
jgi:PAS domain S-box-containing protein